MQSKSWLEMTPIQQAEVLAELLGWKKAIISDTHFIEAECWITGTMAVCRTDMFKPLTDWRSMGLVVEAMAEKGWGLNLDISPNLTRARYSHYAPLRTYKAEAESVPGAVAKAAYKALGGE